MFEVLPWCLHRIQTGKKLYYSMNYKSLHCQKSLCVLTKLIEGIKIHFGFQSMDVAFSILKHDSVTNFAKYAKQSAQICTAL